MFLISNESLAFSNVYYWSMCTKKLTTNLLSYEILLHAFDFNYKVFRLIGLMPVSALFIIMEDTGIPGADNHNQLRI